MGREELKGANSVMSEDFRHYHKEIDRAKLTLMEHRATTFYSSLLSMLNIRISREVSTAMTDGLQIIYSPDFLDSLSRPQILGLTLHEVEHIVNQHMDIAQQHDLCPDTHNIACDHYINLRLLALGYELPPNGYADPQYKGMSSMEIYNLLIKNGKPKPNKSLMDLMPCPDGMSAEEHKERVLNNIVKAIIIAENSNDAGSVPGHLRRNLDDILSPKLPWQTILQQYLTEYVRDDYSMRRPNRRFMPDWYLPVLYGEGLGNAFLYCDVSGSMSPEIVSEIWSEYTYFVDLMNPRSVHVMTGDTAIILDKTYEQGEFIPEFEYSGGGGTIFEPIMQALREEQPLFALLFTDGYFSMPNMDGIDSDIYWIIKGNPGFSAPKGEIIHFE